MNYSVQIVSDRIAPHGARLTTVEMCYPWLVHWDHLRHREQSFSVASNRAIPFVRTVEILEQHPFFPEWRRHQKGMSPGELLVGLDKESADLVAREMLHAVLRGLSHLSGPGLEVHKQWLNKYLVPWNWVNVIVTATSFANFLTLRAHPAAQDELQKPAVLLAHALHYSRPELCSSTEWVTPYVSREERQEIDVEQALRSSVARCARGSYWRQWNQTDYADENRLFSQLMENRPMHASPAEHQGRPLAGTQNRSGNFRGWLQYRKTFPEEYASAFDFVSWFESYDRERSEVLDRVVQESPGKWVLT